MIFALHQEETTLAISPVDKTITFKIDGLGMTFINLGNRSASVVSAKILITVSDESDIPIKCGSVSQIKWDLDFEPIILKAGEMISKDINRIDTINFGCETEKFPRKGSIEITGEFYLITPDVNLSPAYWEMMRGSFGTEDLPMGGSTTPTVWSFEKRHGVGIVSAMHSTVLYRNWSTVFKYLFQPWEVKHSFLAKPSPPPPPPVVPSNN